MASYNDAPFLPRAVESILAQSLGDFEFLVLDDGSTDGSRDYLSSLRDPRLRVVYHEANGGLPQRLNEGIGLARGRYVARMDADDVAAPHRLHAQATFLDANPEVGIVGSGRRVVGEQGGVLYEVRAVPDDLGIRWKCLLGNPFAHPTVMLRRDTLERLRLRYDEAYATAQDYELWTRLLPHTRAANLPEPLLDYRLRQGLSRTRRPEQLANHDRIALSAIRRLVPGFPAAAEDVRQLRGRYGGNSVREEGMDPADPRWLGRYAALLEAFIAARRDEAGVEAFAVSQREQIRHSSLARGRERG